MASIEARPKGLKFRLGVFAAGLEAFSAVALLATSAYLISRASEQPPILYLMIAVVGVRAFALGRAAFRYLQRLLLHDAVFTHLATLRPVIFRRLVELTPSRFMADRGQRINRVTLDVDELQNLGLRVIAPFVQAVTSTAMAFLILIWLFPESGIGILLAASLSLVAIFSLTKAAASNSESEKARLRNELRSLLVEHIENSQLIVSLGWQAHYRNKISDLSRRIEDKERIAALVSGVASAMLGLLAIATVAVGASLAPVALDRGTPGNLLAVAVLIPLALFDVYSVFQLASTAWIKFNSSHRRLSQLFETPAGPELDLPDGRKQLSDVQMVALVGAKLQLGDTEVHHSLDFALSSGQLTTLSGPSGSGKTTIALALSSLIAPLEGKLQFDGFGAEEFSLDSKRAQVVLIEQDPHIFAGSIRQNLEISGVSEESDLQAVLQQVGLWSELEARGGLEAELNEAAGNISGGQAQRLAIARALLANARFLILDEPTSGLDWENAQSLVNTLKVLAGEGRGVLVITHDEQLAEMCGNRIDIGQRLHK